MNGVIQYNSKNRFVKVKLKNGGGYGEVKIYPDMYDPYSRWHTIERRNGSKELIKTNEIEAILFLHD